MSCSCSRIGGEPSAHAGAPCPWPPLDRCLDCGAQPLSTCSFFSPASSGDADDCLGFTFRVVFALALRNRGAPVKSITDGVIADCLRSLGVVLSTEAAQTLKSRVYAKRGDGPLPSELKSAEVEFFVDTATQPARFVTEATAGARTTSLAALRQELQVGRGSGRRISQADVAAALGPLQDAQPGTGVSIAQGPTGLASAPPQTQPGLLDLQQQVAALNASVQALARQVAAQAGEVHQAGPVAAGTGTNADADALRQLMQTIAPAPSAASAQSVLNLGAQAPVAQSRQPAIGASSLQQLQQLQQAGLSPDQIQRVMAIMQPPTRQPQPHWPEWYQMSAGTGPLALANMLVEEARRRTSRTARVQLLDGTTVLKCTFVYYDALLPADFPSARIWELATLYKQSIDTLNARWVQFTPTLDAALVPRIPPAGPEFDTSLRRVLSAVGTSSVAGLQAWEAAHVVALEAALRGEPVTWTVAFTDPSVQLVLLQATRVPPTARQRGSKTSYCNNWNNARGLCADKPDALCKRIHKCSTCGADHRQRDHPN